MLLQIPLMSYKNFLSSGHVLVGFYFTDQRSAVHPSGRSLTTLLLLKPDEAVYLLVSEKNQWGMSWNTQVQSVL